MIILGHGGTVYFIAGGLSIPIIAFSFMCLIDWRRSLRSAWALVAVYFCVALTILILLIDERDDLFLGFERADAKEMLQSPLLRSSGAGPIVAGLMVATMLYSSRRVPPLIPKHRARSLAVRVLVVLSAPPILVLVTYLYLVVTVGPPRLQFDAKEWKSENDVRRRQLARSLVRSKILVNTAWSDVVALLGLPHTNNLVYDCGHSTLLVRLDGNICTKVILTGESAGLHEPPFDAMQWRSTSPLERVPLAKRLIHEQALLLGRSRDEIVQSLGGPEREELDYRIGDERLRSDLKVDVNTGRVVRTYYYDGS